MYPISAYHIISFIISTAKIKESKRKKYYNSTKLFMVQKVNPNIKANCHTKSIYEIIEITNMYNGRQRELKLFFFTNNFLHRLLTIVSVTLTRAIKDN